MRHTQFDLLPPNSTAVERALSLVSAEHRDMIPWDDLSKAFDPWQCPLRLLPWLATVFAVELWYDDWSETRKRRMVASAVRLHRLKGTEQGLHEFLGFVDAEAVKVVTPPRYSFAGSNPTRQERERWVALLPQIRLLYVEDPGIAVGIFCDEGAADVDPVMPNDALDRLGQKAIFVYRGEESDAVVEHSMDGIWRIDLPRQGDAGLFADVDGESDPTTESTANEQTLTVKPEASLDAVFDPAREMPVTPTLEPITVYPEVVAIPHVIKDAAFAGCYADTDGAYAVEDDGWKFVYQRVAFNDPSINTPLSDVVGCFADVDRLGMDPHTVELTIRTSHEDPGLAADVDAEGEFLFTDTAEARVEPIRRALNVWRRASDRVLFDTKTADVPRVGQNLKVGDPIKIGELLEIH